ncbi:MAG: ParB N-terminal domain-containing protein [Brevinema sp.]
MKINEIIVTNRIRKDLGDLEPLVKSLQKYGQLSPIIVNSKKELIAGERRLEAAKILDWIEIDVIIKDLSVSEAIELEMEENTARKEFEINELTEGYKKYSESLNKNIFHRVCYFFRNIWNKFFNKK